MLANVLVPPDAGVAVGILGLGLGVRIDGNQGLRFRSHVQQL